MPAGPNRDVVSLWRLMRDGEWHDGHVIRHDLAQLAGNERGYRESELRRAQSSAQRHGTVQPRTRPRDRDKAVESGKRSLATKAITEAQRFGRIEVDPPGPIGGRWANRDPIRLRWIGPSLLGFAITMDEEDQQAESVARDIVQREVALHVEHPAVPGICAECGQSMDCRSLRVAKGATLEELSP